jgi:hypothetical protein
VARLCKVASIRHVAKFFDLDGETVEENACAAFEQDPHFICRIGARSAAVISRRLHALPRESHHCSAARFGLVPLSPSFM